MSESGRWRDEDSEAARALCRHAPLTREMTPEDRARSRARIVRLGAASAAAAGLSLVQSAALGAGLAVASLVAHSVAPAWLTNASSGAPSSAPAPEFSTRPSAPFVPSPASAAPEALPAKRAPGLPSGSVAGPAPPRPPPPSGAPEIPGDDEPSAVVARPPDSLAEEARLIERARAALATSPDDALRRTSEHAARFPAGKLSMERELVAIDALGRLGRAAEARSRGESLLARVRGSLYEPRLRKLLEGLH